REREPWLLASNLVQSEWNPAKIVAVYKRRMQIEEGFRDVKSEHLGLGLNLHRSHCLHRIEILLLVAALANYLLFLTGLQARQSNLERRYQSNSLRERRVLSLWRLGLEYWRRCIEFGGSGDWEKLEKALRDEVHHQAQSLE
ncbi:transposase, partial [Pseudomonas baetica]|uniref:transposase n=2 Tax=Pseudomonas baetica TaxID=674054 RepID=UPI001C8BB5F0